MSTISMFGTCQNCGLVQYLQGQPCRDCGGKVQSGGRQPETPCRTTPGAHCPSDPVPPAGVEPEVVGYRCRQSETEKWHMSSTPAYWEHQPVILLEEHRAHVTRLQAEVERLKQAGDVMAGAVAALDKRNAEVLALQAELTKARELLSTHCPNISIGVREFLSNQSAPADNGEV